MELGSQTIHDFLFFRHVPPPSQPAPIAYDRPGIMAEAEFMSHSELMTAVDTAWLRMDRPHNLMMITGILLLDGPIDVERVERIFAGRFATISRFHRRIEETLRGHAWVDDSAF